MPTAANVFYVEGLNEMLRAVSDITGREGSRELRTAAKEIAEEVAKDARRKATTSQQRLAAPAGINAKSDRVPTIRVGGARKLTRTTPGKGRKPTASDVIFGADFGSDSLAQFPPEVPGGRLVFKAVKDNRQFVADQYLDRVERLWAGSHQTFF